MKHNAQDQEFLEKLAKSDTGIRLIQILKNIEIHYADIRNLKEVEPKVRVDALKLMREALLDKLLVLSGVQEAPDNDEFRWKKEVRKSANKHLSVIYPPKIELYKGYRSHKNVNPYHLWKKMN